MEGSVKKFLENYNEEENLEEKTAEDTDYAVFADYFDDEADLPVDEEPNAEEIQEDFLNQCFESVKSDLFAEIHNNAQKLKESIALPGGNLDSGEVTDYEKWLEKLHTKQDKAKVNEDEKWAPKLFDKECSENGYHDWDGKKLSSVKEFVKQYNKK